MKKPYYLLYTVLLFITCSGGKVNHSIKFIPNQKTSLFNGHDLGGWHKSDYKYGGKVAVKDSMIILEKGGYLSGVTWSGPLPLMDYEIELDAVRLNGTDFFLGLTFPVDTAYCSLILGGWGGYTTGLSCINGTDASENETTGAFEFNNNTWYHIKLTVRKNIITAWIDDKCIVETKTDGKYISIRRDVAPSIPLGLASFWTRAAFKNLTLKTFEE